MPGQRAQGLPPQLRSALAAARRQKRWSQSTLGQQLGLPQPHISGIENGRVVPRYDTLLDIVRVLDLDLLLVPRPLVPVVEALIHNGAANDESPLYVPDEDA